MKTFKALFLLTLSLGVAAPSISQDTEKTLVKSFNLHGNQIVQVDLEGPVEVRQWKSDIIRVQMSITANQINESTLKSLIRVGRYNLKSKVEADEFVLFSPNLEKEVKIGGKVIKEEVSYIISVPEDVLVKLAGEASTSNDISGSDTGSL